MQGRGHGSDPGGRTQPGHGRMNGRGRGGRQLGQSTPRPIESRFKSANSELPYLNFGTGSTHCKPIEFLQLMV